MYTEEPRREINWGNVIKKGLIIVLIAAVVFLIIWLLTKNTSNSINVDYDNNSNNTTETDKNINSNTYSEIFINNYRYFHDTAKEYFLISNLPEEGKTLKFTLQELIDKKLVLPFSYTSSENCDTEASYVSVKNEDGTYTLTTTLVCGKEAATTKEELGCNQLCNGQECTKEEIEYEYKQAYTATENSYSCPSGYTLSGSKCYKTDTTTIKATKNVDYICKSGYTKVGTGSTATCVKGGDETVNATAEVTYSCPSGYTKTGSGENTKCYKTTDDKISASYTYSCPSGYTLNGTKCTKTNVSYVAASTKDSYSCPSGYTLSGSKCTKTTTSTVNATSKTTYSCSKGTLSGTKCNITDTETIAATSNISYYCPSGYDKNGNTCIKYLYTNISYGSTYQGCTGGQLVNTPCSSGNCTTSKYVYKCTQGVSSATTYNCPSGYTKSGSGSSTKCTKTTTSTVNATAKTTYSCSNGTLSGTKCNITNTETINATKSSSYYCENGTLNGSKCVVNNTSTVSATKNYYCSNSNYELSGKYCYSTNTESATPIKTTNYVCEKGYTKSGSGSNTKCTISNKVTEKVYKNTTYTCQSGYTKVGSGSTAVCTKGSTSSIAATVTKKNVTKYLYKWSTAESLSGWERTGKTRNTTASSK